MKWLLDWRVTLARWLRLRAFVVWLGTVQMEDIKNLLSLPDDARASVTVIQTLMST